MPGQIAKLAIVRLSPEGNLAPGQMVRAALEDHKQAIGGMTAAIVAAAGTEQP